MAHGVLSIISAHSKIFVLFLFQVLRPSFAIPQAFLQFRSVLYFQGNAIEKPVFRFISTTAFRTETHCITYLMRFFCFSSCSNHDASIKALQRFIFIIFRERNALLLSCYFTKKRSSKIFKIEKINRQTNCKNGLILSKSMPFQAETWT